MTGMTDRAPVRSYQRIFRPERRIYQVEGHRLPVPGGVPLRWVGYALTVLVAVIVLSGRSPLVLGAIAVAAAAAGWVSGRKTGALLAGVATFAGAQLLGFVLAGSDWPLRLLIVPAFVATLATQATPDGRLAHRYAISWLGLQLRTGRRSLGRPLPPVSERRSAPSGLWVEPDCGGGLRRGVVRGPATVTFAAPVAVTARQARGGRRMTAAPALRAELVADRVELSAGDQLEVRP